MDAIARVLRRASDLIGVYGHAKGRYGSRAEGFCLWGAVRQAEVDEEVSAADIWLTEHYLAKRGQERGLFRKGGWSPVLNRHFTPPGALSFNDMEDTTPEEVQKFLLQTADEAEVEE